MGFLGLDTIREQGFDPLTLAREGLIPKVYTEKECAVIGGALFIYDPISLKKHLEANPCAALPADPEKFVEAVATQSFLEPEPYRIVGQAFADPRFSDFGGGGVRKVNNSVRMLSGGHNEKPNAAESFNGLYR